MCRGWAKGVWAAGPVAYDRFRQVKPVAPDFPTTRLRRAFGWSGPKAAVGASPRCSSTASALQAPGRRRKRCRSAPPPTLAASQRQIVQKGVLGLGEPELALP